MGLSTVPIGMQPLGLLPTQPHTHFSRETQVIAVDCLFVSPSKLMLKWSPPKRGSDRTWGLLEVTR